MPRGKPGKLVALRLDPVLLTAVREHTTNVTAAVQEGLRMWLAYERRKAAKVETLAKHLAPPTAGELVARKTSDAA